MLGVSGSCGTACHVPVRVVVEAGEDRVAEPEEGRAGDGRVVVADDALEVRAAGSDSPASRSSRPRSTRARAAGQASGPTERSAASRSGRERRSRRSVHPGDDTRRAMCGRMTQQRPTSELAEIFEAEDLADAPRRPIQRGADERRRGRGPARRSSRDHGLPLGPDPPLVRDTRTGNRMFNARAETLDRITGVPRSLSPAALPRPGRCVLRVAARGHGPPALRDRRTGRPADRARRALVGLEGRGHGRGHALVHDRHDRAERHDAPDPRPDAGHAPGRGLGSLAGSGAPGSRASSRACWCRRGRLARDVPGEPAVNDVRNDGPDLILPLAGVESPEAREEG